VCLGGGGGRVFKDEKREGENEVIRTPLCYKYIKEKNALCKRSRRKLPVLPGLPPENCSSCQTAGFAVW
jgi:hypothetical protein